MLVVASERADIAVSHQLRNCQGIGAADQGQRGKAMSNRVCVGRLSYFLSDPFEPATDGILRPWSLPVFLMIGPSEKRSTRSRQISNARSVR